MKTVPVFPDSKSHDFAGPCPRCGGGVPNNRMPGAYPGALSRFDNETYVCSSCGTAEAMMSGHAVPFDIPLDSSEAEAFVAHYEDFRVHSEKRDFKIGRAQA